LIFVLEAAVLYLVPAQRWLLAKPKT